MEVNLYRKLCHNLHKDTDFPVYDIDSPAMYKACVDRMYAATKAEQLEHRITKLTSKRAWENKAAEEAEIVLDKMTDEEQEVLHSYHREKKAALNALKVLLRQPFGKNTVAATTPGAQPPLTQKNTTKLLRKRRR
uniref:Uncharacterized protein n=1 Tax=Panagrolaimus superbus TaxID=310955 RepID=A0A914YFM3_9BILA